MYSLQINNDCMMTNFDSRSAVQSQNAVNVTFKVNSYSLLAFLHYIVKYLHNVVLMLDQRRRRWTSIKSTLCQRVVSVGFAGQTCTIQTAPNRGQRLRKTAIKLPADELAEKGIRKLWWQVFIMNKKDNTFCIFSSGLYSNMFRIFQLHQG